jgi:phage terminase small subunit
MTPLTNAKHEAVALAYLTDPEKVGWRAYRKVYPRSSRHAAECGFTRLQKNVEFSARIADLAEQAAQGAVMTAQEALVELTKLARANMQDYMHVGPDGDPVLDYSKLTRDQAAALQEVTVDTYTDGRGDDAREVKKVKFKLADKLRALELIGKHHKLFTERHEHNFVGGVAERLTAALKRIEDQAPHGKVRPHRGADRSRHATAEQIEEMSMPTRARRHRARRRGAA